MVRAFLCKFILINYVYETVPSSSPVSISSSDVTSTSAVISWDPPPYEDQNGVIISYTISVSVQETGESFIYTTSDTTYSFTALKPYRTYDITIAASTSVGTGPYSDIFMLTTAESSKSYMYDFISLY